MSARRELERAVRKAERREGKRRPRMPVSGKSVLRLGQLMEQRHKKSK